MARFDLVFDDDFVKKLEKLDYDTLAPQLLEAGIPIVEKSLRKELAQHADTHSLMGSIKNIVKKNRYGWFAVSRPTGRDKKGVRNMAKLLYIEFGTKRQPARPLMTRALKNVESETSKKMQEKYNELTEEKRDSGFRAFRIPCIVFGLHRNGR